MVKKAKYTLNDTGLLGDDVEYSVLVRGSAVTMVTTHLTPPQTALHLQQS